MNGTDERRQRWERRWAARSYDDLEPVAVVTRYHYLLPTTGRALDLACGLGLNALFLAAHGLECHAWDYSSTAIARLAAEATRRGLTVHAEVHDLAVEPPPADSFDVIVVSRFLERELCPAIARALRPGGLLLYQSFVRERVTDAGPDDRQFRLAVNELPRLFPGLWIRVLHDEGAVGDTARGFRDESMLVAQRPPG